MAIFQIYLTPSRQYAWRLKTEETATKAFANSGKNYANTDATIH